ncbi:uncharacterized protein LOC131171467 [Hevea brasiliensis]|uniref:uncharacterized protein LOC131171467 n=1 Tax=Hevea brasiliensis TaxID=3981 RepID=UPI0025E2C033|nr:uncharacterized protein LOC131171467 [Hevea brasiliensis]
MESESSSESSLEKSMENVLHLQNSDNPGLILVIAPLNGTNYLPWSRAMKIALCAKDKIGFVTGEIKKPSKNSPMFKKWRRVDSTFWESNGPLLYNIKREISLFTQGNMPLMVYFTKLKKLWDEVQCLRPFLVCTCGNCTCGASKAIADFDEDEKLIQFLMGLGDHYDHVRNQMLLIDPLPSASKAYSMALRVEKKKDV